LGFYIVFFYFRIESDVSDSEDASYCADASAVFSALLDGFV